MVSQSWETDGSANSEVPGIPMITPSKIFLVNNIAGEYTAGFLQPIVLGVNVTELSVSCVGGLSHDRIIDGYDMCLLVFVEG